MTGDVGQTEGNPRFRLRAYAQADSVRLALIFEGADQLTRDEMISAWAERWPRHAAPDAARNLRRRVSTALNVIVAAGLVVRVGDGARVADRENLAMAASNADVVMDEDGVAVRPGLWTRRPTVPADLVHVQEALESQRAAAEAPPEDPAADLARAKRDASEVVVDPYALALARRAVEDLLVEFRDSGWSVAVGNGLVIAGRDGQQSSAIRLSTSEGLRIGISTYLAALNARTPPTQES